SCGGGGNDDPRASGPSATVSDPSSGMVCNAGTFRKAPIGWPDTDKMWAALSSIQPGDWLYIDNGNDMMHSIVFVVWTKPPVKVGGTATGTCRAISQL